MTRDNYDCETVLDSIEAHVDGELESAATAQIESHLASCAGCRAELELAVRVRDGLRSLPTLDAPAAPVAAVLAEARDEASRESRFRRVGRRRLRAVLAAAAALGAIALALTLARSPQPEAQLALDDPAVVRATLETKLALARLAEANRRVGRGLGDDLLRARLVEPMARGVAGSLDPKRAPAAAAGSAVHERG